MTIPPFHKKFFQMFYTSECIKLNQMQPHSAPLSNFKTLDSGFKNQVSKADFLLFGYLMFFSLLKVCNSKKMSTKC